MNAQGAVRSPLRPSVQTRPLSPREEGTTQAGQGLRLKENRDVVRDVLQGDHIQLAAVEQAQLIAAVFLCTLPDDDVELSRWRSRGRS